MGGRKVDGRASKARQQSDSMKGSESVTCLAGSSGKIVQPVSFCEPLAVRRREATGNTASRARPLMRRGSHFTHPQEQTGKTTSCAHAKA